MSNVIFWSIILVLWILMSWYWVKKEHPKFWVMYNFFFLGWTAAHLLNSIFKVFG